MAEETLAEGRPDTVEFINDENMNSTANVKDPTKPHDATIPEPERDGTMPDDPTFEHESAHHARGHAHPGTGPEVGAGPAGPEAASANDQNASGSEKDHAAHEHARSSGGEHGAGKSGTHGKGGPKLNPEEQKLSMELLDTSLKKADWAWQTKNGPDREIGHQSVVHMERAFIMAAQGDRKGASDLYQKHAGRPPSEALMKRVDEMSSTNFAESLRDLNHGINHIAAKKGQHDIAQQKASSQKLVKEWKKGVQEAEQASKHHRKRALDEMLKNHAQDHSKEHGQFIIKGAWKSLGAGGDLRKAVTAKFSKISRGYQHFKEKRNLGHIKKQEKKFSLHTANANPLNAKRSGKAFEVNANDNEKAESPQKAARTTGMSGAAADKFQGVTRGVQSAHVAVRAAREAGRMMKAGVDAVGRATNRVLDAVSGPDARRAPAAEQQQAAGQATGPKIDLGAPPQQAEPTRRPDAAEQARNAARQAQQRGMGQGMGM